MKKACLLSVLLLLCLFPSTVWANSPVNIVIRDIQVVHSRNLVELEGEVKYVKDLETPHYELNGFVLQANFDLKHLEGHYVRVKGYRLEGPSIFMKNRLLVREYEILYKNKLSELEGVVRHVKDLETPHYELNGIVLQANFDLKGLEGYYVKVKGYMLEGPSIFMKERMLVKDFEVLNKGEILKMKGVIERGFRFNDFILLSKLDLRPYMGKEVEITAKWDMERSNAKQKYLQVLEIKEVRKDRIQIVRERVDPRTGIRYIIRYYLPLR